MNITIDCNTGGPLYEWGDHSVDDGIGGSEEAAIYLSRELVKLGHKVIMHNNCGKYAGMHNGVEYQHFTEPVPTTDVYIAWRNWHLCVGRQDAHKWVWCHDLPLGCHCPTRQEIADGALNSIDKFVVLNSYHQRVYMDAGIPEDYTFVSPNGIQVDQFDQDIERDLAQVIYFSHPGRGLDRLREVWPEVHRAVPEASLASFWWEPEHFRSYNSGQNILPMRKLGHMELAAECLKSGVFGYPSVFAPEICPITTMKAQLGGAIPVVVIQGGMIDTIKYGVQCSQGMFAQELISALKMSIAGDLESERSEMMTWAKETYSWKSVAEQWSRNW